MSAQSPDDNHYRYYGTYTQNKFNNQPDRADRGGNSIYTDASGQAVTNPTTDINADDNLDDKACC